MNRHTRSLTLLSAALLLSGGLAGNLAASPLAGSMAALISNAAPVTQTAGQRIAVVDTGKVFTESRKGKAAMAELKNFQDQKRGELTKLVDEIKGLQQRITDGQKTLGEDKLVELRTSIDNKGTELRRREEDANREADRRRNTALEAINQQVMPIIQQVAKEKGYSFIFKKFESGLVYTDGSDDITADVIAKLNASGN